MCLIPRIFFSSDPATQTSQTVLRSPIVFYAAPGKNFDAAPAPTLLYSKAKILKQTKVETHVETIFLI
jgi:hypothetical protein